MTEINGTSNLNIESFINNVSSELLQGDEQDKKVTAARVRMNTEHVHEKRQEHIDHLAKQMKGVAAGGGCLKVIRVVFKMIDFLFKPLSAVTLGSLKMDLSKALEMLQEAKKQGKLLNLKVNGEEIIKALQNFKKLLEDDMQTFKAQDEHSAQETKRIMEILEEINECFESTTHR